MKKRLIPLLLLTGLSLTACQLGDSDNTESTQTESKTETETPKTYKVTSKELIIEKDNQKIYGKIYMPEGEGSFPAIILSHGYNGIHDDFASECKYFASNGYVAYAFDFCGGSTRSKSSGSSTDMTIFTEKENLLTVFEHISTMDRVDSKNIFLFGGSQGGLVTSLVAEELQERARGMILYYPAFNIPDDWRKTYPSVEAIPEFNDFWGLRLGQNFFVSIHDFYTFDNIGSYPNNVLIIHGDKDNIAPLAYSQNAVKLYSNANLIVMQGEGHGYTPAGATTAMKHALTFMSGL